MRLGLDATPLLGARTGIGRYTERLLGALADDGDDELVATAFTLRGRGALQVPPGVEVRARGLPARGLQEAWARTELPPVEWLTGRLEVFHATNFVLPPMRHARGVVTVHDLAFLRMTETVSTASARYRALVPRSIRRAAVVVTPSEAVAEQVSEAYAPSVPVLAVPHGVAPGWSSARPPSPMLRRHLALPSSYVLFVGTLEPRKDVRTLLAAHRLLPDAPPLVLVGPPGWGEQVDVGRALTPGYLDEDDLRQVVAGAAVLVLPSRDEGFGLPLLEALAAGTPVVASDLPVLREVGGDQAVYAPVGDAPGFAAALEQVLHAPGAADGRRQHASRFTWAASARGHRAAYSLALS
jgi:glycosyltransferase involved in cell wall biosynthesis